MIYTHKDCLLLHKNVQKRFFKCDLVHLCKVIFLQTLHIVKFSFSYSLSLLDHTFIRRTWYSRDCIKMRKMNQTLVVAYLTQLNWMASLTSLLCHHDMKLGIRIPLSLSTVDPLVSKSKHLIRRCVWGKIFYLVYTISHQSLIFSSHSVWSMLPRKAQTNNLKRIFWDIPLHIYMYIYTHTYIIFTMYLNVL